MLARHLGSHGWEAVVVTTNEGPLTQRLRDEDLPVVVHVPPPALGVYGDRTRGRRAAAAAVAAPRWWASLARQLCDLDVQVVHAVGHRGVLLAAPAARLARLPVLWHVQGTMRRPALNRAGRLLVDDVVVLTRHVLRAMPELEGRRAVTEIPIARPAHLDRDEPCPRPTGSPLLVAAGRLHPDKGFDVLLDAMVDVVAAVPDVRLKLLIEPQQGAEHLGDALAAQVTRLGLGEVVTISGFVPDPERVLAAAAAYVQPSRDRTEQMPNSILEAQAVGVPVVASDVGGVPALVEHLRTGLLVPAEDRAELADALVRVLVDDDLAERLRRAAFDHVQGGWLSEDAVVGAFATTYRRLVGEPIR